MDAPFFNLGCSEGVVESAQLDFMDHYCSGPLRLHHTASTIYPPVFFEGNPILYLSIYQPNHRKPVKIELRQ